MPAELQPVGNFDVIQHAASACKRSAYNALLGLSATSQIHDMDPAWIKESFPAWLLRKSVVRGTEEMLSTQCGIGTVRACKISFEKSTKRTAVVNNVVRQVTSRTAELRAEAANCN